MTLALHVLGAPVRGAVPGRAGGDRGGRERADAGRRRLGPVRRSPGREPAPVAMGARLPRPGRPLGVGRVRAARSLDSADAHRHPLGASWPAGARDERCRGRPRRRVRCDGRRRAGPAGGRRRIGRPGRRRGLVRRDRRGVVPPRRRRRRLRSRGDAHREARGVEARPRGSADRDRLSPGRGLDRGQARRRPAVPPGRRAPALARVGRSPSPGIGPQRHGGGRRACGRAARVDRRPRSEHVGARRPRRRRRGPRRGHRPRSSGPGGRKRRCGHVRLVLDPDGDRVELVDERGTAAGPRRPCRWSRAPCARR